MADPLREAIRAHALGAGAAGEVSRAAAEIARLGGGAVVAVVFFGSRKTRPSDDPWSAHDFFVLTDAYRPFYAALQAARTRRRSALLLALLNRWLPPSQIALRPSAGAGPLRAKCAVISLETLLRETSPRRRDHFCAGRLFQPTEVAWWRDDAAAEAVLSALVGAHRQSYAWVRPFLPEQFDAASYAHRLLTVSMRGEIRPEPRGRADVLFESQREYHRAVYALLLAELAAAGELVEPAPGRYALARPAGAWERLRVRLYFRRSLLRATARWAKHMLTFDDWLEYILHKARRHTGQPLELSERERRWPLLFLWPRLFRYLREKDSLR